MSGNDSDPISEVEPRRSAAEELSTVLSVAFGEDAWERFLAIMDAIDATKH